MACIYHHKGLPSVGVEVKIYSLKDDSWRSIHFAQDWVQFLNCGKFVNGKLHWANINGLCLHKGWNIISLDLSDEKWEKVEQPCYDEKDAILVLGVLENNLSMICDANHQRTYLDVWVMKEYRVKNLGQKCLPSSISILLLF